MGLFHLGLGLQLIGLASVGACLICGLSAGDYGRTELILLVAGSLAFWVGSFCKNRCA